MGRPRERGKKREREKNPEVAMDAEMSAGSKARVSSSPLLLSFL